MFKTSFLNSLNCNFTQFTAISFWLVTTYLYLYAMLWTFLVFCNFFDQSIHCFKFQTITYFRKKNHTMDLYWCLYPIGVFLATLVFLTQDLKYGLANNDHNDDYCINIFKYFTFLIWYHFQQIHIWYDLIKWSKCFFT